MAKKATTKTGATGTMGSTGVNDPTSGGGNNRFDGTEGIPNAPTVWTATEVGGTTPTGGGGTSGLSDTSFDDDSGVKKKTPRASGYKAFCLLKLFLDRLNKMEVNKFLVLW
jgi:hypothetical protein